MGEDLIDVLRTMGYVLTNGEAERVREWVSRKWEQEDLRDGFAAHALEALISKAPLFDREGEHGVRASPESMHEVRREMAISAYDYAEQMLVARAAK